MTGKKKNLIAENQYIFLAFIVTMGTMLIVFLCNTMVPFGDKTILRMTSIISTVPFSQSFMKESKTATA